MLENVRTHPDNLDVCAAGKPDRTLVQVRLADGSRLVGRFNPTQTVADLHRWGPPPQVKHALFPALLARLRVWLCVFAHVAVREGARRACMHAAQVHSGAGGRERSRLPAAGRVPRTPAARRQRHARGGRPPELRGDAAGEAVLGLS